MDIYYHLNGVDFVWHDEKAQANIIKHDGITFKRACSVFFDPFFIMIDASQNYEQRQAVIGYDNLGKMLFVVHIEVEDDIIRIISARFAEKQEIKNYDNAQ